MKPENIALVLRVTGNTMTGSDAEWSNLEKLLDAARAEGRAEADAERDLLQEVLDSRPAINAALPGSYISWSRAVMSGDVARAYMLRALDQKGGADGG